MTAREIAYNILKTASKGITYSNIVLDNALKKNELSDSDRGLVTSIVMGVTERRLTLDYIIDRIAEKPETVDNETRVLLQMGIYQVVFFDRIPEYAAVNETVNMAKKRSRGFVNAIMRSLLRKMKDGGIDSLMPDEKSDAVKYLSIKYSFPEKLCERFGEIYGFSQARRIFEIFNLPPKLTLRINTLKISRDEYVSRLEKLGIKCEKSERLENAVVLDGVSFSALPNFADGYFFIQDEASQICVEALGASEGELLIDVCSCPGSKSFGSAIKMNNQGRVLSFDLHESKLSLVKSGAERLGINIIETGARNGREFDASLEGIADRVLCDVPCSGLGVIAKKPEIRYKDIGDFERLPEIQYEILENASRYVKRGGYLVYSTCTVLPEENEINIQKFLSEHKEYEAYDFNVGGIRSTGGMLTLSPDLHLTDGFFVAKLKKK